MIRIGALALCASLALAASSAGQQTGGLTGPATAEATAYTALPPPPSASERARLVQGMSLADTRDWAGVAQTRDAAGDPLVRKLLQWRWAASTDAPLYFDDLSRALTDLQGWPARAVIRARAEEAILDSRLSAADRVAFLRQENGPATGNGRMALALALKDMGQRSEAEQLARAAWREDTLSTTAEARARQEFSFSADDHAARVDILLWREQRTAARALLPLVSPADRALANARIALQSRQRRGLQAAVDAVPSSRRDAAGLLYDRAQYIRRSGRPEDAMPVAARIDAREAPAVARDDIYRERRLYVPRALRAGNQRLAYNLVSNHGLTSGEEFADAEWLSGWLQLRFLAAPAQAEEHFRHLSANVSAPVSSSRAYYWRAEAVRALGRASEADELLANAARFPFTYYGQLAAQRRSGGSAMLDLPDTGRITDAARNRFENRELVRALRLMAEVGDRQDFESIAFFLDDTLEDPMEVELLAQLSREQAYTRTALRNAKAGLFRGVVAVNAAYPMLPLPSVVENSGRPEPALVYAIIRQESEFEVSAISSANARGLMQLIPSTAQAQARREGIPYQRAALTTDGAYNMTLGAAHLGDLVDSFGGSYVLAIASYNAGSHRAREWIADYGDPRSSSVDVVDWVELIPFAETRNYVQRVTENLQVYRHRIEGRPTPIRLQQDLERGR
jgi:soluble lytic murein transglycosylase